MESRETSLSEMAMMYDKNCQKKKSAPSVSAVFMDAYMQAINDVQGILNAGGHTQVVRMMQRLVMSRNVEHQSWRQSNVC